MCCQQAIVKSVSQPTIARFSARMSLCMFGSVVWLWIWILLITPNYISPETHALSQRNIYWSVQQRLGHIVLVSKKYNKSDRGVPVAAQKGRMSSKNCKKTPQNNNNNNKQTTIRISTISSSFQKTKGQRCNVQVRSDMCRFHKTVRKK